MKLMDGLSNRLDVINRGGSAGHRGVQLVVSAAWRVEVPDGTHGLAESLGYCRVGLAHAHSRVDTGRLRGDVRELVLRRQGQSSACCGQRLLFDVLAADLCHSPGSHAKELMSDDCSQDR